MRTFTITAILTIVAISPPLVHGQRPAPGCPLVGDRCDLQICDAVQRACPAPGPQEICETVRTACPPPSPDPVPGVRDASRDLVIKNSDLAPESIVDVAAAEVILQNGEGDAVRLAPVGLSVDADGSGANGVDMGAREPGSWYHIWIIFDPLAKSVAGLLSLDSENPALPVGYQYKARVGAIRTDSSTGDLIRIHQVGHRVMREPARAILQSSQTFHERVSIAPLVPPTAKQVSGSFDTVRYDHAGYGRVAATAEGLGALSFGFVFSQDGSQGNLNTFGSFQLTIAEPQTLYLTLYSGTVALKVSGWEF